jgi:hypothetical protein
MSWLTDVAVGAGVVITVVGTLIWLAKKGYFEPDTNEQSQEEREELSDSVGGQDFHIPSRRHVGSWSLPYKVFVGSLVLLVVSVGVATYQVMKTGSPVQQYLTREVRYGMVALIGVAGGARLKSWFDSQIGTLAVVYERTGQENVVETINFARQGVRRRNGVVTLPEVARNRLLGLFWRYRQVGEDRRLRGEDKPLDDVVTHQVPDHGDELPDGDGWIVTTREDGDEVLSGATSTADVTYSSPNSLSDERATQLREQKRRKEAELRAVQATNAELYKQIKKMRKKIENEEYQDRTDLIEDFSDFAEMYSTLRVDIKENGDSESAVEKNGDESEATA